MLSVHVIVSMAQMQVMQVCNAVFDGCGLQGELKLPCCNFPPHRCTTSTFW